MKLRWLIALCVAFTLDHVAHGEHFSDQRTKEIDRIIEARLVETRLRFIGRPFVGLSDQFA